MNTKGIILDIRSHPTSAGRLLNSWFVSCETPFVKHTKGNPDNPGEFIFTRQENVHPSKETYQGKLVVLVNEETLSEGEYEAMMYHAGRNTTIIGSQTAGADGRVSDIFLPGGIKTWISGVGVYYPDGRETQRIGIVPDVEVKPTIKGITEGRDEMLEKAIEIIEKE
jgi:C-terminal processing protease CtpA/Prc